MKFFVKNNYLFNETDSFRCAIGLGGTTKEKIEGDQCTPIGEFKFNKIYYRSDKLGKLDFLIPSAEISFEDGWCDDTDNKFYNQFVKFPFDGSAERLHREDDLYDIVCVMNYNTEPVIPGKGSAIFLHICKNNFTHTEGCVAVKKEVLLKISRQINENTTITIED